MPKLGKRVVNERVVIIGMVSIDKARPRGEVLVTDEFEVPAAFAEGNDTASKGQLGCNASEGRVGTRWSTFQL